MAPMIASLVVLLLGSHYQVATAATLKSQQNASLRTALSSKSGQWLRAIREVYTTNAICSKKNCINPVFPGMEDLHRLSQASWIASTLRKTSPSLGFCKNAISYDPALPMPGGAGTSVKELVQRQDNAAATMFYYHLTGLGLEAWDYQEPEYADDCVKSAWRMACYTYFPRAEIGVQDGAISSYVRPCQSSCQNYVRSCQVECCDESVQCVFKHTKVINAKEVLTTEGYSPHDGPSSMCTGASHRSALPMFWIAVVIAMVLSLQGCDTDIPEHKVGNWRAQPDYLLKHEYILPGASARNGGALNSCSIQRLSPNLQCSGRGSCKLWHENSIDNSLAFCECDRDWTDPECRTRRKSQTVAYLLALFLGFVGADQFYLGFVAQGLVKLFSFGGFGILWISDVVKIGSAPVYASKYRTAADLPHFVFVLSSVFAACFAGFTVAYFLTQRFTAMKRREAMFLQAQEEARQHKNLQITADSYAKGQYGAMTA